jgi:methylmalonyl-CoA mutase N-terminal domain/subunit
MGGAQSLHTNAMDEALALPSEHAATLALRTQQIIGYETGVADTIDPLAGSYVIESLTSSLLKKAQTWIEHIDALGGMVAAIEQGYPQKAIQDAAYETYVRQSQGKEKVVGVNAFVQEEQHLVPLIKLDPHLEKNQKETLQRIKHSRDQKRVKEALSSLETAARSSANTMPYILQCVKAVCSLGEIADVFRSVWGVHKENVV